VTNLLLATLKMQSNRPSLGLLQFLKPKPKPWFFPKTDGNQNCGFLAPDKQQAKFTDAAKTDRTGNRNNRTVTALTII